MLHRKKIPVFSDLSGCIFSPDTPSLAFYGAICCIRELNHFEKRLFLIHYKALTLLPPPANQQSPPLFGCHKHAPSQISEVNQRLAPLFDSKQQQGIKAMFFYLEDTVGGKDEFTQTDGGEKSILKQPSKWVLSLLALTVTGVYPAPLIPPCFWPLHIICLRLLPETFNKELKVKVSRS